jgi:hypothetical protein
VKLHKSLNCYLITQSDEMLTKDSLREKLFRNQVGGEGGTIPKLLFEKKGLILALPQLLVSRWTRSLDRAGMLCHLARAGTRSFNIKPHSYWNVCISRNVTRSLGFL